MMVDDSLVVEDDIITERMLSEAEEIWWSVQMSGEPEPTDICFREVKMLMEG